MSGSSFRNTLTLVSTLLLVHSAVVLSLPVAQQPSRIQSPVGDYIAWREYPIDDEELAGVALRGADGLVLADFDGDGLKDIVSVHEDSHHVRIAFATPDPTNWDSITLAEGEIVREVEDADVGDIDNDGDQDIVVAMEGGGLVAFINPGIEVRHPAKWQYSVPANTRGRGSFIRVALADLDGDNRLEVIAANKGETQASAGKKNRPSLWDYLSLWQVEPRPLSIFKPVFDSGNRQAEWPERELARLRVPINAEPVDLDGDGDLDIVGGGRGHQGLLWFENRNGEFYSRWLNIDGWWGVIGGGIPFLTGQTLAFDDINGDGRLDIVTQFQLGAVGWLEQPAVADGSWQAHHLGVISPDHVAAILIVDVDGDGYKDVFVGGYSKGRRDRDVNDGNYNKPLGRLAWFKKLDSSGNRWQRLDISRRIRGMYDEFAATDMDHDGDIDLVGTRGNSGRFDGVFWIEQLRSRKPSVNFSTTRPADSPQVPLPHSN